MAPAGARGGTVTGRAVKPRTAVAVVAASAATGLTARGQRAGALHFGARRVRGGVRGAGAVGAPHGSACGVTYRVGRGRALASGGKNR